MLTIAVVDDEEQERRRLNGYIQKYCAEHPADIEVKMYADGLNLLDEKMYPDIIFTDIDMPMTNGLEMAKAVRKRDENCVILFITRLAQYAINGYEVSALDFVVKPIQYDVFLIKLEKAIAAAEKRRRQTIAVVENYMTRVLALDEITYAETQKHKLVYHLVSGETVETWDTLQKAAERLESRGFRLCNSGYLVNLRHVAAVGAETITVGKEQLKVSRQRKKAFLDALAEYLS